MSDRAKAAAPRVAAFLAVALIRAGAMPAQAADALSEAPPGAASCSGCHPAHPGVDTPLTPLAGFYGSDIVMAMQVFRDGRRPATVMDRIARGFSDEEIEAIQAWYMAQRVIIDAPPRAK